MSQNLQSKPEEGEGQTTLNSKLFALGTRFDILEAGIKRDTKELKENAKDQKMYFLLGTFILGVMIATMLIMVGSMVLSAYQDKSSTDAQLNANISTLLQKIR